MEKMTGNTAGIGGWLRAPGIEDLYIDRVAGFLQGKAEVEAKSWPVRGQEIHASDLQGCPMVAYFQKVEPDIDTRFPLPRATIMRFMRGIAIENMFRCGLKGQPPRVLFQGISCSVDDYLEDLDLFVEIKTTTQGLSSFDPLTTTAEWTERIGLYASAHEVEEFALMVFFIAGNMSDFLPWAKNRDRSWRYNGTDLRAYRIIFDKDFLDSNFETMEVRRDRLVEAVAAKSPKTLEQELHRREGWMCKSCRFAGPICPYKLFIK